MTTPDRDDLDWDVKRDGRMAEHATGPEDEPKTSAWEQVDWDLVDELEGPGRH